MKTSHFVFLRNLFLITIAAFGTLLILAGLDNAEEQVRVKELFAMEHIGEIRLREDSTSTADLFEFQHPTRPGVTCLWMEHGRRGGLSCWTVVTRNTKTLRGDRQVFKTPKRRSITPKLKTGIIE